jgi:hypothetical protein
MIVIISLRVPSRDIRNFTQFSAACKNCPAARYTTAENLLCSAVGMFSKQIRFLKQILNHESIFC